MAWKEKSRRHVTQRGRGTQGAAKKAWFRKEPGRKGTSKVKKLTRLLKTAWKSDRKLFLVRIGQNLFEALLPMVNIVGIGVIIDALTRGRGREEVFAVIVYYVSVNSVIALTRDLLSWLKNVEERKLPKEPSPTRFWFSIREPYVRRAPTRS